MAEEALFIYSGGNWEGNYLRWRFFFFVSSREDKMRAWLGTATAGQKGQTRGPASAREADVRQEAKDAASCFFTDLWRLNGDRPRGAPSKEYLERVRARELLVASYVSSYDVSSNPTVTEGESIQSVKKNRRTLVE